MDRRFSDEQVAEIMRRAAEFSTESGGVGLEGLSESELKRIASEIGLSETSVNAAINEVGQISSQDSGGALSYERTYERRIQGEVGEEDRPTLLEHFVPEWGFLRTPTKVGSVLSYRSMVGINNCQVSVSQRSGKTTLKVTSHAWVSLIAAFLPAVLLCVLAAIFIFGNSVLAASDKTQLFGAIMLVVWVSAVIMNIKLVKFSNKKVERLTNAVAAELADSADHIRERLASTPVQEEESPLRQELSH